MFDEILAPGLRHHAYGIEGPPAIADELVDALKAYGVIPADSPDIYRFVAEQIGVEESTAIRERARGKPFNADYLVVVAAARVITREAQNALLKTLEDPMPHAVFFIITPSMDAILPTVRSRLAHVQVSTQTTGSNETGIDAESFLVASPATRLSMIAPIIEERNRAAIAELLAALEARFGANSRSPEARRGLSAIYTARRYLNDRGASLKMLLEHVSLVTPQWAAHTN